MFIAWCRYWFPWYNSVFAMNRLKDAQDSPPGSGVFRESAD